MNKIFRIWFHELNSNTKIQIIYTFMNDFAFCLAWLSLSFNLSLVALCYVHTFEKQTVPLLMSGREGETERLYISWRGGFTTDTT